MTMPAVSVVVPFLNAQPFMEESIESVRAPTYPDWELLLVDDGSRDGTSDIARAHALRDPERVRYFEHPGHARRGASAARNLGLHHARGQYIAFLDADDVWLPEKLASQIAIIEAHPEAAMVYNRTQYWHSWTGAAEDRPRDFVERARRGVRIRSSSHRGLLTLILRQQSPVPCMCSVLHPTVGGRASARFRGRLHRSLHRPGLLREGLAQHAGVRRRWVLGPLPPASGPELRYRRAHRAHPRGPARISRMARGLPDRARVPRQRGVAGPRLRARAVSVGGARIGGLWPPC